MPLALFLMAQAVADPAMVLAAARARTAAEVRCPRADVTDVTVCGRRNADRFRVPLVGGPAVDPANDVRLERSTLLHRTNPVQDLSPFLVGGGMAGVTVGTSFGASGSTTRVRPLAP